MSLINDDDDDYMSAAFLQSDLRPGLRHGKIEKDQPVVKKLKVVEQEKREEGLKLELDSKNKGFLLMQKMGYKPGLGIGKKEGLKVPIPLNVKIGRAGLGQEREMEKRENFRWKKLQEQKNKDALDYQNRVRTQREERQAEKDLYSSQRVCEQIETEKGVSQPLETWFWPERDKRKHESDSEEEEEEDDDNDENEEEEEDKVKAVDQLRILTEYLRKTYLYCIWCGTRFDDAEDLKTNCPGDDFASHQ